MQSWANACRRQKISTTYACRMIRNNLVIKVNRYLSHQEICPARKSFTLGNSCHWKIVFLLEIFITGKYLSSGNLFHLEILTTRNSFPPGNLFTRKSFTPGIPSHQEILHTGNSFPPGNPSAGNSFLPGNPSHREFLQLHDGNSFPPGNPSHQEILPTGNSLTHQEILHTMKFFRVSTRMILVLIEKSF